MDVDLVRQIWLRADRIRERGLRTPDLTDLLDIASEFGALDWKLVADLSALLDGQRDVMARPRVLMEFINELSRRLHPGRVLDPFVPRDAQRVYVAEQEDAAGLTNVLGCLISCARAHFSSCSSENVGVNSTSVPLSASH